MLVDTISCSPNSYHQAGVTLHSMSIFHTARRVIQYLRIWSWFSVFDKSQYARAMRGVEDATLDEGQYIVQG